MILAVHLHHAVRADAGVPGPAFRGRNLVQQNRRVAPVAGDSHAREVRHERLRLRRPTRG